MRVESVLVDELVIDLAPATPIVSLRCGVQEFGWHEVPGSLWDVREYVETLAADYGTKVVEVNGGREDPESVARWITGPLAEQGFSIREMK